MMITNCGNNYGEFQSPEKLIPKTIINCINKKPLPIYGEGKNIRDWIHVDDHVDALIKISIGGSIGESYNIGSNNEVTNNDIVHSICSVAQKVLDKDFNYSSLIEYVDDRPGHDFRYAMDTSKINSFKKADATFTSSLLPSASNLVAFCFGTISDFAVYSKPLKIFGSMAS